jgi:hypothetical protein
MIYTVFETGPLDDIWSLTRADDPTQPAAGRRSYHETKEEAIAAGKQLARRAQPSCLVVRQADGTVEQEFLFGVVPVQNVG